MRKILLIAVIPGVLFLSGCGLFKEGHGGNCNCPKFGKAEEKQQDKTEQVASVNQEVHLQ